MLIGKADTLPMGRKSGAIERGLRALGAVSLFWKVLLANACLVLGSVVAGMLLASHAAVAGQTGERWVLAGYAAGRRAAIGFRLTLRLIRKSASLSISKPAG